ncbi:RHS repeat domain-containing protein [Chlamydiota bacterium]
MTPSPNTHVPKYPNRIDEPLTISDETDIYYYHRDALGSIISISDDTGTLVEKYIYDAYGKVVILNKDGGEIAKSTVGNRYMFTGREWDNETNLYYYRARYYDPDIGRFLSADPLGYYDSMNLYSYVNNNPLNWVDPLGLFAETGSGGVISPTGNGGIPNYNIKPKDIPDDFPKDCPSPIKKALEKEKTKTDTQNYKAKEKKTRKETIKEHWRKYRNPRDQYEKNDMRKQIRRMIRDFRKYFGRR